MRKFSITVLAGAAAMSLAGASVAQDHGSSALSGLQNGSLSGLSKGELTASRLGSEGGMFGSALRNSAAASLKTGGAVGEAQTAGKIATVSNLKPMSQDSLFANAIGTGGDNKKVSEGASSLSSLGVRENAANAIGAKSARTDGMAAQKLGK